MNEPNPCQSCGACCSAFRVTFYWAEGDDAPGGKVPIALTNQLSPTTRCMKGTDTYEPRCIALSGTVGECTRCTIYENRPSPCREVVIGDEFCGKARAHFGLPPLQRHSLQAAAIPSQNLPSASERADVQPPQ